MVLAMAAVCVTATAAKKNPAKPDRTRDVGTTASVTTDLADRVSSTGMTAPANGSLDGEVSAVAGGGNDSCTIPQAISGIGVFPFDNTAATMDGPAHEACHIYELDQSQVDHDVWFCWTAPPEACDGTFVISTCERTEVDTRIAVYNGCGCPTNDNNLLNCRDDDCDEVRTRLLFNATPGQQYMIRLGTYIGEPGGTGSFQITCEEAPPCEEPLSHCQPRDTSDAINSNRTNFATADGFIPAQSGNINSVCWWGTYLNSAGQDCEASTTDSFRIRYFNGSNGLPTGLPIATFSQQLGNLFIEPAFSTGLFINGVAPEYEFHATHGNVPVVAGNCYWIEITNQITGCTWFWELGLAGDGRLVQDGADGQQPGTFTLSDVIVGDTAFCTNLPLDSESTACLPPPPPNDNCANRTLITGPGTHVVDTASATTDGPAHQACLAAQAAGIGRDVWYEWTSTCSGNVVVRTCEGSAVDTKIAAYSGTTCPTSLTNPVACNDDLCGVDLLQSMVVFPASINQKFLIRAGVYPESPGGVMSIEITCGGPDNESCGIGSSNASCCAGSPTSTPGCADETCCAVVCACDPFCCEVEWDGDCATNGLGDSGCGATDLCGCESVCGNPSSGSCCTDNAPAPGCNDDACCEAVCACDSFCCDTEWDFNCAGAGFVPGCGAAVLCEDLCGAAPSCPTGTVTFTNPPNGAVDARRPHPPGLPNQREGFTVFTLTGPPGANASCFSLAETATFGAANTISSVVENPAGTYTVTLSRPITSGAGTSITYTPTSGTAITGCFKSHPANVNSDTGAAPVDILDLIDNLNGVRVPPLAIWQCDLDRSGVCLPADIITEIDMLNGANGFIVWNGTSRPVGPGACP
jgi:hypothetical protein